MAYKFARGKISPNDHFDGHRFFNPWETDSHGFKDFLKIASEIRNASWPDSIEVKTHTPPAERVHDGIQYVLINHSTVLIQTRGLNILTDPVFSKRASPVQFAGPRRVHQPGIEFTKLPPIDVVLVSHNHYDHLDLQGLRDLDKVNSPLFITSLGNELYLKGRGLKNVKELDWWESVPFKGFEFYLTPAQHFSSRSLSDRDESLWGSFVIKIPGPTKHVFFGGDTGYAPFFKQIFERFGPMDLSFIPIGAYEPRWFMRVVHMNPEDAVMAHIDLKSRQSVGIHFGCFKLTAEPIDEPPKALEVALRKRNVDSGAFEAPEVGFIYSDNLF